MAQNSNCLYLVDYGNGQDPVLLDPRHTAFRVAMGAKASKEEAVGSKRKRCSTGAAEEGAAAVSSGDDSLTHGERSNRSREGRTQPGSHGGRGRGRGGMASLRKLAWLGLEGPARRTRRAQRPKEKPQATPVDPLAGSFDDYHSETDEETILMETCPKCQVRSVLGTVWQVPGAVWP